MFIHISEKLYAKVDKSRKSRISSSEETTPLTSVVINGGPTTLRVLNEADPDRQGDNTSGLDPEETAFIDNDLYEKDSEADGNSTTGPSAVSNFPVDDETYEIPEDVVNQLDHENSSHLIPPTPPLRTTSSPRNSSYFDATPPVPKRHSSLALTSFTPPLPPRQSMLLSTPPRTTSKSIDVLDREHTPKLPPRLSLMLPTRAKSVSPEQKRATFTGHFIPMPISKARTMDTTSESDPDSSSESDFEELPPPREHAPPLPDGAEAPAHNRPTEGATAAESDYLEPISLRQNDDDDNDDGDKDDNHDYDPVYIPSNPGASHIAHLVDNTNYLKGARNRSPSKASINPYEEIQFGTEVYADVDESTMTTPPEQRASPAPPMLTPRSSRLSDLVTPPQLSPRSPGASSNASQLSPRPPSTASGSVPELPPRSSSTKSDNGSNIAQLNGRPLRLPSEPRYSGLLTDSGDELDDHDYTPLDYEDHPIKNSASTDNTHNGKPVEKGTSNGTSDNGDNVKNTHSPDNKGNHSANEEDPIDYADASTDNNDNDNDNDELYEPIEGADKDGVYEAIDFGDD